jgi:hypothetical protein
MSRDGPIGSVELGMPFQPRDLAGAGGKLRGYEGARHGSRQMAIYVFVPSRNSKNSSKTNAISTLLVIDPTNDHLSWWYNPADASASPAFGLSLCCGRGVHCVIIAVDRAVPGNCCNA